MISDFSEGYVMSEEEDEIIISSHFNYESNLKVLRKFGLIFLFLITIAIIVFIINYYLVKPKDYSIIALGITLIIFSLFPLFLFIGTLTLRGNDDPHEYMISKNNMLVEIPRIKYIVPISEIKEIKKLPKDFHSKLSNIRLYNRGAWNLPRWGYSNPFMLKMEKPLKPITKLGGAIGKTIIIIGDDDKRSAYNYIKKLLRKKKDR